MEQFKNEIPKRLCIHCGKCDESFPQTAFSEMPEGCGLEGYLFLKQEEHKQKVRKLKEDLVYLDVKIANAKGNAKKIKYQKGREKVLAQLKKLEQFGPVDF